MKFKAYARMQSCPSIKLKAKVDSLDFRTSIGGSFHSRLGPFSGHIGEIPIRLTIPFLKHRPIIASVGDINFNLDSFQLNVENVKMDLKGVLGLKGITTEIDSKIDCNSDINLEGTVQGRIGLSHFDLGDEDNEKEELV